MGKEARIEMEIGMGLNNGFRLQIICRPCFVTETHVISFSYNVDLHFLGSAQPVSMYGNVC